jgi:serine-type D-Ala-D-Ala carboxypeptidase/endopeptidase (penicillin-binding protein 4)
VARSDRRRRRRVWPWVAGVVALVLVGGGAAAYRTDPAHDWADHWVDRWLGHEATRPLTAPVPGFTPPPAPTPRSVARPAPEGRPTESAVRRALGAALHDPHLADLRAVVAAPAGRPVLNLGHGTSTPASTLKLLTSTAALEALGPDRTFATRVVASGHGRITLVGGGDPFLAGKQPAEGPARHDASLQTLARLTAADLRHRGVTSIRLSYDDTLFTGPAVNPHWPQDYVPDDVVTPITALWADEGLDPRGYGRVADPPATAAALFAGFLRRDGVRVAPAIGEQQAKPHAREVAHVESPPVADVVERTLQYSDNEGAEVLARQVGLEVSGRASYAGGVAGVRKTLQGLGIDLSDATIQDGSGLSRHDRLDAATLVRVLQVAASPDHPELRSVLTGLPVAAYDGSLASRFTATSGGGTTGRGLVRAKTGTLTGTSALAGTTTDARGRLLVFAFVSNHVKYAETLDTRAALDRLSAALATCRC